MAILPGCFFEDAHALVFVVLGIVGISAGFDPCVELLGVGVHYLFCPHRDEPGYLAPDDMSHWCQSLEYLYRLGH